MTTPINPTDPSSTPSTTASSAGGTPPSAFPSGSSNIDPTGVWTRFLSSTGHPATPKDVRLFINGLLKTFSIIIQQDAQIAQRAAQRMKRAIEGK